MTAKINVMVRNTTYEGDDFFKALLTNGTDEIALAEAWGGDASTALNQLSKDTWIHYKVEVPPGWTTVQLKFSSSTNSSSNAEEIDFDNIEFRATSAATASGSWKAPDGGAWSQADSWNGDVPLRAGDTANFGPTSAKSPATVDLGGSRTLSGLTFNNTAGYTLSGGPNDTLFFDNGTRAASLTVEGTEGRHEIAVPVALFDDLDLNASVGTTLAISGKVMGYGALVKSGGGTLELSNPENDYAGGTTVLGGRLDIADAGALPAGGMLTITDGTVVLQPDLGRAIELGGLSIMLPPSPSPQSTNASTVAAVPEPASLLLLLAAAAMGLATWFVRRRRLLPRA